MQLHRFKITTGNASEIRQDLPLDQRELAKPGERVSYWTMDEGGRRAESITVFHERKRAAYFNGGNSEWGEWDHGRLYLDDGTILDANGVEVDQHGQPVWPEEDEATKR
jgi:hypothetical protein